MSEPGRPAGGALVIPGRLLEAMRRQLEAAYPREGCGVLLGSVDGKAEERRVERLEPADNRWEGRDDRYLVDPATLRRLLEEEEAGGPRIVGFYHSHPDAPPEPSGTDRELAWPWYHYLIVSVRDGVAGTARAWTLADGDGPFEERPVRSQERPARSQERPARTADGAGDRDNVRDAPV